MTHNTPAPVADKALAERLALLSAKAIDEDLMDNGRYFSGCCTNLTSCNHGDTGEFGLKEDGKLVEMLWNAHRSGQLITLAEADARVAAERERIIAALREEASVCPCDEDQIVIADCADLIEADFSYEDCEKLKIAREAAAAPIAAATGTGEGE